jgi:hypothetical protein
MTQVSLVGRQALQLAQLALLVALRVGWARGKAVFEDRVSLVQLV